MFYPSSHENNLISLRNQSNESSLCLSVFPEPILVMSFGPFELYWIIGDQERKGSGFQYF